MWSELNNTASWQVDWATNTVTAKRTMPYGEPRDPVPPNATSLKGDHGFVDGVEDSTLGMVNVGARDYDPSAGRFLSIDPLIDLANPQTWNGYLYGGGNPISHPDPSGLMNVPSGDGMGSYGGCDGSHGENSCGGGNHHGSSSGKPKHKKKKSKPSSPKSGGSIHTGSGSNHSSGSSAYGSHGGGGGSHHSSGGAVKPKPKKPSFAAKYRAAEKAMRRNAPDRIYANSDARAASPIASGLNAESCSGVAGPLFGLPCGFNPLVDVTQISVEGGSGGTYAPGIMGGVEGSGPALQPRIAPEVVDPAPPLEGPGSKGGESSSAAYGRKMHGEWDYGPGFVPEFRLANGQRADGVNIENREVVELKPDNPRAIRRGALQAKRYAEQLDKEYPAGPGEKPFSYRVVTYGAQ